MPEKPTYEELEQRVKELEKEVVDYKRPEEKVLLHREIVENMAEGVYLIRTSDGGIVYANKRFEDMFGYDSGELVNKHVSIVNAPSEKPPEEIANDIVQSLGEKGTWSGEVHNIKKDGTQFWCHANVSTLDHQDYGKVWVSVHEDIDERKKAQEELRKHQKHLEELVQERTSKLKEEIEERKQAEEALRESARLNEMLLDSLPHPAMLIDRHRTVIAANKIALEVGTQIGGYCWQTFGHSLSIPEEHKRYIAEHDGDIPPSGTKCTFCLADQSLKEQAPFNTEVTVEGTIYDTWWVYVDGDIFLHYAIDITERKRVEEALMESKEELRTIVDSAPLQIWYKDRDNKIIRVNQAGADAFGKRIEDIESKPVKELFPEADSDHYFEDDLEVINSGKPKLNIIEEMQITSGERRYVCTDKVPYMDKNGKINGVIAFVRDITDIKQAEEALRESEARYRMLFEKAGDAIFIMEAEGPEVGKIMDANPAAAEMHGYTADELLALNIKDLEAPDAAKEAPGRIQRMLEGEWIKAEIEHRKKDGTVFPIELSAGLIELGNRKYILGFDRDATERKRLQAQLERAQKMEAIGVLAGGVAHDLNNILAGLVSYPDLLLMEIPKDSPLRNPILTMQKSGQKAATIVEDLLTLARRGVAVTEVVNLNDIISEYVKSPEHERLISFHANVHVRTDLEGDLLNILGSPAHLSKTIMNLVSNAAEAMPEGGEISISTENQYIDRPVTGYDHVKEGDYVVLRVSDTGVGISKRDRDRIFEPFYTKKVMGRSGTGLGMTVVWGTVKDHNGYIDIQSAKGKGTTLTLYFPVSRKEVAKDKSLLSIEDYMAKGESVLVIDDVEEQREIASRILNKLGYSVTSVSSGEEAVEYLKDNSADLLILDMIMDPGIDGLETYNRILEFRPEQKAIIVSGFSETKRVKKAQRLGAGAYVKKPFLLEKIGVAVRDELDK